MNGSEEDLQSREPTLHDSCDTASCVFVDELADRLRRWCGDLLCLPSIVGCAVGTREPPHSSQFSLPVMRVKVSSCGARRAHCVRVFLNPKGDSVQTARKQCIVRVTDRSQVEGFGSEALRPWLSTRTSVYN